MRAHWTAMSLAALILVDIIGTWIVAASNVAAQTPQLAVVFRVEVGRDVCEVQYRRSTNDHWGTESLDGPPMACQGGVTYGVTMTIDDANREVAQNASLFESGSGVVVPLTGDEAVDQAAIDDAVAGLHESVDTGDPGLAFSSDLALGFMAPDSIADALVSSSAPLAAEDGRSGHVGQKRRADVKISTMNDQGYGSKVEAIVVYKRISCARWKITHIRMTPILPIPNHVWFRNFYYKRWAWLGDHYGDRQAGKQCRTLKYGETYDWQPDWQIRAKAPALIELVDEHPMLPGNGPSCFGGAGTSYASGWFYLPEGTK